MYPRIRNVIFVSVTALVTQGILSIPYLVLQSKHSTSVVVQYYLPVMNTLVFGGFALYGFRRSNLQIGEMFKVTPGSGKFVAASFLLVLPISLIGTVAAILVWKSNSFTQVLNKAVAEQLKPMAGTPLLLFIILVAPVTEELFFRGFLFRGLLKTKSFSLALVLSSILFSIFHINPSQMVTAVMMGFYCAYIFYVSRSIVVPMVAHAIFNTYLSVLPYLISKLNLHTIFPVFPISWYTFDIVDALGVLSLIVGLPLFISSVKGLRANSVPTEASAAVTAVE